MKKTVKTSIEFKDVGPQFNFSDCSGEFRLNSLQGGKVELELFPETYTHQVEINVKLKGKKEGKK